MITGLSIMVVGLMFTIQQHYRSHLVRQAAICLACLGIGIYIVGRVSVFLASRRARKMREQALENSAKKDVS